MWPALEGPRGKLPEELILPPSQDGYKWAVQRVRCSSWSWSVGRPCSAAMASSMKPSLFISLLLLLLVVSAVHGAQPADAGDTAGTRRFSLSQTKNLNWIILACLPCFPCGFINLFTVPVFLGLNLSKKKPFRWTWQRWFCRNISRQFQRDNALLPPEALNCFFSPQLFRTVPKAWLP